MGATKRIRPRLYPQSSGWKCCAEVSPKDLNLIGYRDMRSISLAISSELSDSIELIVKLIEKHPDVPMSLAAACLVRMTETLADPVILTTDQDFRVYRCHSEETTQDLRVHRRSQ